MRLIINVYLENMKTILIVLVIIVVVLGALAVVGVETNPNTLPQYISTASSLAKNVVSAASTTVAEGFAALPKNIKVINATSTQGALPGAGQPCGGTVKTALACVTGYHCAPAASSTISFSTAGGTCVKN